ncbi:hypothetical protein ABIB14_003140 [Arthrobacter sp. UYEF3]
MRAPEVSVASTEMEVALAGGVRYGADCGTSHFPSAPAVTG